jgi:formylglycine-generating enzyme required for sulfatase activity
MRRLKIILLLVFISVQLFAQGAFQIPTIQQTTQIDLQWLKANGITAGTEQIIANPYMPNNYFIRDRFGNYGAYVFIPKFNFNVALGFSAVGRGSEAFGTITRADTLVLNSSASSSDDAYNDGRLTYNSETRYILDYTGSSRKVVLAATDTFSVRPTSDVSTYTISMVHPAFIVNGTEIDGFYVGKYEASIISNTGIVQTATTTYSGTSWDTSAEWITANKCATSRVNVEPQVSIDYDAAKAACDGMNTDGATVTTGKFHLISNAEWSAIALWTRYQTVTLSQTWPRGNNLYGVDADDKSCIFKIPSTNPYVQQLNGTARSLTGSGGYKTSHNREVNGIYDLNGNVWEWNQGLYVNEGKIYVAGNSNTSPRWGGNSIDAAEVNFYDTGVYYNWDGAATTFTFSASSRGTSMSGYTPDYKSQQFNLTNTNATDVLKLCGLTPINAAGDYGSDYYYVRNYSSRFPLRGGSWYSSADAGVFHLYLYNARSNVSYVVGLRVAFVKF